MYFHPKKLPVNEDRIIKRRIYEDDRNDRLNSVHNYEHLMRRAEFEQSNEPKTSYRTLSEKLRAIRAQREEVVAKRRRRIRELLEAEENSINEEIKTGKMNLAERRAWLEAEARRMKSERFARMQKYAEKQMDRAFKESSDDVRIQNSKMAVLRAEEERKKQRETNIQRMLQGKDEEKALHKKMELEWQKQDEIYRHEVELQQARKQEAIDILREQLFMVQRLREEERAAVEEDMRNLNKKWLQEEEELKKKQYEKRCEDGQKARETLLYNEQNRLRKMAKAKEDKSYDAHLVAMVAEREAAEEKQERELRDAQKREAKAYAAQLKAALEQQKLEDDELEAIIKAEVEQGWRKQDEHTQLQEDMRRRLMDDVHHERQAQLQFKECLNKEHEQEKRIQLEKNKADALLAKLEDEKRVEQVKFSKEEVKDYLQAQMRHKKAEELVIQQNKRADFEDTKKAEQKYEERVKHSLTGLPYPEPYYGRKAVKWYE